MLVSVLCLTNLQNDRVGHAVFLLIYYCAADEMLLVWKTTETHYSVRVIYNAVSVRF